MTQKTYIVNVNQKSYTVKMSVVGGFGNENSEPQLIQNVTSVLDVGGISAQQTINKGTTFTEFVQDLLTTTFYPTFTSPTMTLSADVDNNIEVGSIKTITLTVNFDRGAITGDLVNEIWNSNAFQDYRAGTVDYYIIDSTDTGTDNNKTLVDYSVVEGSNSWAATTYYNQGPAAYDSEGNIYSSGLSSGDMTKNIIIYGRRKCFYGVDNSASTSDDIRLLPNGFLKPEEGGSFTINIPAGTTKVVFAYPATLRDVDSVKYVEGLYAEIKDVFTKNIISVEGANGYNPVDYKVYTYEPVEAFDDEVTYEVTI